ncbi:M48 family metalloprotease [Aurantivibrio plasticivorans]
MRASFTLTRLIISLSSYVISFYILSGCAINPATGDADFVLMSEEAELELGKEAHEKIIASGPIYEDEDLQHYINDIGQKLVKQSDRPDLTYTFTIIDSPDINAFALPGGYIYVHRGLISYLQSEAQLAAVLAHEISHVTARHAVRQDAAQKSSKVGTGVASILSILTTGTNVGGELTSLYSSAAVSGYGRDMELEADRYGAEYLYRTGYNPQAMVEVIGVLKDQERFSRLKAKDQGKKQQTYHGVFSTHPRNDQRLREIVDSAGKLSETAKTNNGEHIFREKTQDLIFGINYEAAIANMPKPEPNRYTHAKLGFTMLFPEDWGIKNERSAIIGREEGGAAQLSLGVARLNANIPPDEYIRTQLGIELLMNSQPFVQHGLIGHTGLAQLSGETSPQRIAVLYQNRRVYIFRGRVLKSPQGEEIDYDALFLSSIRSFQPTRVADYSNVKSYKIHYVKTNKNTTFAALAQLSPLRRYAEQELRLLNGYYPNGEPRPGEWIKIIK